MKCSINDMTLVVCPSHDSKDLRGHIDIPVYAGIITMEVDPLNFNSVFHSVNGVDRYHDVVYEIRLNGQMVKKSGT